MHPRDVRDQIRRCQRVFFYRDEQRSADGLGELMAEFSAALIGVPAGFAMRAWDDWLDRGTRAPLPGDIANRARMLLAEAQRRLEAERPRVSAPPPPEPLSDEEAARRARLWADETHGTYLAARPSGRRGPAPTWPRPMTDAELEALYQRGNRRVRCPGLAAIRCREGISVPAAARHERARLAAARRAGR